MKAILVIDVPDGIDLSLVKGSLTVVSKDVRKLFMAETYQDLEVRPLPHKLQADWYTDGYKEGFNACLEEITGETE